MKAMFLSFGFIALAFFSACSNEDDIQVSLEGKTEYVVQIASPIDIEAIMEKDSVAEIPVYTTVVSGNGIKTKSVVEEIVPTFATLTHYKGVVLNQISGLATQMICDKYTLTCTVNYKYGQAVISHTGAGTGYNPSGSIRAPKAQKAVQNKIDDANGSWTLSSCCLYAYYDTIGRQWPGTHKWFPFHYNDLNLYYTWIDGNN